MPSGERDDYSTSMHNIIYTNILITKGCFLIASECWTFWWAIENLQQQTGRDYMNILKSVIFEGALMVVSLVVEKSKF